MVSCWFSLYSVEGTSIKVKAPKDDIDKLRLEIAGSGAVRNGRVGFEIFDKWTSKGQLFFEFRAPIGRSFDHNWKSGLGVRFLF